MLFPLWEIKRAPSESGGTPPGLSKNPGTEFCAGVVQLQNLKIVKIFKRDENKISCVHNFNFIHNQKRNIDKFKQTRPHSRIR